MGVPLLVLDLETLVALATFAFVIMGLIDAVVKPITDVINAFLPEPEETSEQRKKRVAAAWRRVKKLWPKYVAIILGGTAVWFTKMNVVPAFWEGYEVGGRIVTCLAGGLGPSFIYDLMRNRPKPPPETETPEEG